MVVVQASEVQLESALRQVGGSVRYVEQDLVVYAMEQSAHHLSWGLDRIDDRSGLDDSYTGSGTSGGSGVHVYVLDTGIRTTHEDFEGRAVPTLESLGSGVVVCDPSDTSCANDGNGHGTHCAGTVGGREFGVAKAATLHAVQVLSASGSGTTSGIIMALDWVATSGERPAVVSMSLGGPGVSQSMRESIDGLVASGVVVVVAAGNSNSDACGFSPAFVPSAITVGSTETGDRRSSFSCYGSCLDIWAPGTSITSSWSTSDTATRTISGTSMACPHVAGAAALLLGVSPSATPANVLDSLLGAATSDALTDVKPGSPNLLLFTPPGGDNEPRTTTTRATVAPPPGGATWTVESGPCAQEGRCISSPNFPNSYGNGEICRISVPSGMGPISIETFDTERGYDMLRVNGEAYHGSRSPEGVTPTTDITWSSDQSVTRSGWKICAEPPAAPSPATTTTAMLPWTTTTGFPGGGETCRCECVCQCPTGSSAGNARGSSLEATTAGSLRGGSDGEAGALPGQTTATFAGVGLVGVAVLGLSSGVGFVVGRRVGGGGAAQEPEPAGRPRRDTE